MEPSFVDISTAFVTGLCVGLSQLRIEILECAAKRTAANRLKYIEMSFVLSCCEFVGNSTASLISRVASKSSALIKKTSESFLPLICRTGASGGDIPCLGVKWRLHWWWVVEGKWKL